MDKENLRKKIAVSSSYIEIYISVLIVIGITILSVTIFQDLYIIVRGLIFKEPSISMTMFLADALQLIIGIEFVKMLSKHTPGSTIDVLLFAIARRLVTSHESMVELLIGVIAIAILFIVKKILTEKAK
ncbi:MAG: hypothetical protein K0R69_1887 [Clostridia bacterium]|jgi:phosphate starvation-inducible membrane PsiE|nr:hypothetical protein [Clostridia bacterium]